MKRQQGASHLPAKEATSEESNSADTLILGFSGTGRKRSSAVSACDTCHLLWQPLQTSIQGASVFGVIRKSLLFIMSREVLQYFHDFSNILGHTSGSAGATEIQIRGGGEPD